MLETARAALLAGGTIVVHATLDALLDALPRELPGELVIVAYTPGNAAANDVREFAIAWWWLARCRPRARSRAAR